MSKTSSWRVEASLTRSAFVYGDEISMLVLIYRQFLESWSSSVPPGFRFKFFAWVLDVL